ncbi:efflux RND transporter periplasmic adaptor subunit [Parahaliea mediterranea]|uniref:efflux RND transporter periplasmic adaptor subunit n=1 Tax=Parahaliea mediterranea TaxID=651086 RepID=UPI000C0B6094|nr:efflux RND transporter periplasmic adaptor subunit [Parahaliea mediterranea]MAC33756.1 efflux transporter periplasmic adaptor subunit [Haliea sp.]
MNVFSKPLIAAVIGIVIGAAGVWLLSAAREDGAQTVVGERKPLYWVAPMDPNYRRDKPGKSPMGMDLIPVYEEGDSEDEAGTVQISPDVVNNLGVRTASVESGRLSLDVKTVGYVQYDEDRLVHIHPRVEGWVEKLHVKADGDPVEKGEPLYALYSPTLVNAQEELVLALKRDNPQLVRAAVDRLTALQVPQRAIEQLRQTRQVNQAITIAAPQSGVVDNLGVREGMFVKPGMSLMTIGQLEHVWVIGEIFERQASLVRTGNRVRMRLDYLPGREWLGQVDYVYPSLNDETRTVQIRVHFDNADRFLKPGMFAEMHIQTQPGTKTLLIPREALIRTGTQERVVLALGEGRFKSIAVKVGRVGERQVEILSGLKEGEHIVTSAQFLIDSESSKTSDFKRMSHAGEVEAPLAVWVQARIESLMPDHWMVTLAHAPIDAWQWPAMTMDFAVAESVDMEELRQDMRLQVQVTQDPDKGYRVTQVRIPDQTRGSTEPYSPEDREAGSSVDKQKGMTHEGHDQKESDHD